MRDTVSRWLFSRRDPIWSSTFRTSRLRASAEFFRRCNSAGGRISWMGGRAVSGAGAGLGG